MPTAPTIVWFRRDLRIDDNPALVAAVERGAPVLPVFVWAPDEEQGWSPGAASQWWLHQSLASLQQDLQRLGSPLVLRSGESLAELRQVIDETGAEAVYWNRGYEPAVVERDQEIKAAVEDTDLDVHSFNGNLLYEPWEIQTQQDKPYQVFTPFWKNCQSRDEPAEPVTAPSKLQAPVDSPESLPLEDLKLEPTIDWAAGFREEWQPGAAGATKRLDEFIANAIADYPDDRDRPDRVGTSRLSPHLHFGEIGPRRVWETLSQACSHDRRTAEGKGLDVFRRELGWREFAHHVLFHFPDTADEPLRGQFNEFPWGNDGKALRAWQRGMTGYPIVDAGMRELWHTGWMHNRVRMIVGSFLTKDLLISWREGAKWFWDTLVDADLANNTLGWQWVSGCGADAAPYFRIFNPVTQGKKFDPDGQYVRRWIPELGQLPNRWIHEPWSASSEVLTDADVRLGETYPEPIVDHGEARQAALHALEQTKGRQ